MCHLRSGGEAGHCRNRPLPQWLLRPPALQGSPLALVDFGSAEPFRKRAYAETSREYAAEHDDEVRALERITGTASYLSPEVANTGRFSSRSDVWSCGVMLYILFTCRPVATDHTCSGGSPFAICIRRLAVPAHG